MAKPSRYNPRLSLEQYIILVRRKQMARSLRIPLRYKDLVVTWGIKQSVIGSAVSRGIKQYNYIIQKRGQSDVKSVP